MSEWTGVDDNRLAIHAPTPTSHLDVESEIRISQTLRQLGPPVLLIAHRPETIASADRVLSLTDGGFTEQKHLCTTDNDYPACDMAGDSMIIPKAK